MSNGPLKPPESAEKSLGEIVNDVSTKASLLVREEIELAKAELQMKARRLAAGAAAGAAAAVFGLFAVIFLLHALSWGLSVVIGNFWSGFLITGGGLLILAGIAALIALRAIKRATPPKPELAIDEAKKTRAMIEEART